MDGSHFVFNFWIALGAFGISFYLYIVLGGSYVRYFRPTTATLGDIFASTGPIIGINILFLAVTSAFMYVAVWIIVRVRNNSGIGQF